MRELLKSFIMAIVILLPMFVSTYFMCVDNVKLAWDFLGVEYVWIIVLALGYGVFEALKNKKNENN